MSMRTPEEPCASASAHADVSGIADVGGNFTGRTFRRGEAMRFLVVFAASALAVLAAVSAAAAPPQLWIVDLGTLGGSRSEAVDINNSGQVVGWSYKKGPYDSWPGADSHAFLWMRARGMVDLTPGGHNSKAVDINDNGQVVGYVETSSGGRAFLWQSGHLITLPGLGGDGSSDRANAVNERGQVVGISDTRDGSSHAFVWTRKGGMVDLGTLGGRHSEAVDINNNGQVVGTSDTRNGGYHGFVWTREGGMVDLGTLGGSWSEAVEINDSGEVVGDSSVVDAARKDGGVSHHAFFWTREGGMVDLGTLGGADSSAAAVNDRGEVAGHSDTSYRSPWGRAFVWTREGGMVNLGTVGGGIFSGAVDINNNGQVVGGSDTEDYQSVFSWTHTSGMVNLGNSGGSWIFPIAVNDSGQIVGASYFTLGDYHAHAFLIARAPWPRIPPLD